MEEYGLMLDNGVEITVTAPKDDTEIFDEMMMCFKGNKPWYVGNWSEATATLTGTDRALEHINMHRVIGIF